MQCLKKMIIICEKYANSHSITFNPTKSKSLCFNVDHTNVIPQTYLNGEVTPVVDSDKHLGNYISTNITDRNIIGNICDLYQRSNRVISDFRVCDSKALDSLHRTYCSGLVEDQTTYLEASLQSPQCNCTSIKL